MWISVLPFTASAQETTKPLVTPNNVSVTPGQVERLNPGDNYSFKLVFSPAPDGYRGGSIGAIFERIGGPAVARYTGDVTGSDPDRTASTDTKLEDRKASYNLKLTVTDKMELGKWKLSSVSLGRYAKVIPFSGDYTFEIPDFRSFKASFGQAKT